MYISIYVKFKNIFEKDITPSIKTKEKKDLI